MTAETAVKIRFPPCHDLQDVLDQARAEAWPDVVIYLSGRRLNLMNGPHREGNAARVRQDRIMESVIMSGMDGGDW